MPDLTDLPFTPKARARAVEYGHAPRDYADVEPESVHGKYTIEQVQEVQAERVTPAVTEPEPIPVAAAPSDIDTEPIDAGMWRGHPNYGCPWCEFTALNRDRVLSHIGLHSAAQAG